MPAPERRELAGLAVAAALVAFARAIGLGERLLGTSLPGTSLPGTFLPGTFLRGTTAGPALGEGVAVVLVHAAPWLLGLAVVGGLMASGRLPRAQQRLREPSLVAGWVTVAASSGAVLLLGRAGVWPWTWATTAPATAALLTRFVAQEQVPAFVALVVATCLLVPLLSELFFRYALLEGLRARGQPAWLAVALSSVAFGLYWFLLGWRASAEAALQQAAVASIGGAVLGTVAVRGRRGRGLGLSVLAHVAWMATDTVMLLRALPPW